MDIFAAVVFCILGAALVVYVVSPTTARGLDTFGSGFVPYRSAGWPHGVQEEEPVHYSLSEPEAQTRPRQFRRGQEPEVVEITGPDAPDRLGRASRTDGSPELNERRPVKGR